MSRLNVRKKLLTLIMTVMIFSMCLPIHADSIACAIQDVRIIAVDPIGDEVVLKNITDSSVDMTGWFWCRRRSYVLVSSTGPSTLAAGTIGTYSFSLNDISSDVGLYINSAFGSSSSMVDFMMYSSNGSIPSPNRVTVASGKTPKLWPNNTELIDFDFPIVRQDICGNSNDVGADQWCGNGDCFNACTLEGDLNCDNKVDINDFSILAANWLSGTH